MTAKKPKDEAAVVDKGGRPTTHGVYAIPSTEVELKRDEIVAVMRGTDMPITPADQVYVGLLARSLSKIEAMVVNGTNRRELVKVMKDIVPAYSGSEAAAKGDPA